MLTLKGKKIIIPHGVHERFFNPPRFQKKNIENQLKDFIDSGKVRVIIIPDIESVNYGRTVGYNIVEHKPPEDIRKIKGRELRKNES